MNAFMVQCKHLIYKNCYIYKRKQVTPRKEVFHGTDKEVFGF